MAQEKRNGP